MGKKNSPNTKARIVNAAWKLFYILRIGYSPLITRESTSVISFIFKTFIH